MKYKQILLTIIFSMALSHCLFAQINAPEIKVQNTDGYIGIGSSIPREKLDVNVVLLHVNGKIKTAQNEWSDSVFKENYHRPSLKEVENYIHENGHLKDIPSEEEVITEGYILGDMDTKLLQKIEELTLYIIEQDKEVKALEERL